MSTVNQTSEMESFEKLLLESEAGSSQIVGTVVPGRVISIHNDMALIDVGLKSEGRVAVKELTRPGSDEEPKVGDIIDVYVERMEDKDGLVVLSREKARREEAWGVLERSFEAAETVLGTIFGRVKGGFTVDLSGAVAFLPRSVSCSHSSYGLTTRDFACRSGPGSGLGAPDFSDCCQELGRISARGLSVSSSRTFPGPPRSSITLAASAGSASANCSLETTARSRRRETRAANLSHTSGGTGGSAGWAVVAMPNAEHDGVQCENFLPG